jgi:hypothetical protein
MILTINLRRFAEQFVESGEIFHGTVDQMQVPQVQKLPVRSVLAEEFGEVVHVDLAVVEVEPYQRRDHRRFGKDAPSIGADVTMMEVEDQVLQHRYVCECFADLFTEARSTMR